MLREKKIITSLPMTAIHTAIFGSRGTNDQILIRLIRSQHAEK